MRKKMAREGSKRDQGPDFMRSDKLNLSRFIYTIHTGSPGGIKSPISMGAISKPE
jgi:hypothetical protein